MSNSSDGSFASTENVIGSGNQLWPAAAVGSASVGGLLIPKPPSLCPGWLQDKARAFSPRELNPNPFFVSWEAQHSNLPGPGLLRGSSDLSNGGGGLGSHCSSRLSRPVLHSNATGDTQPAASVSGVWLVRKSSGRGAKESYQASSSRRVGFIDVIPRDEHHMS